MPLIEVQQDEFETAKAAQNLLLRMENDPKTRNKIFEVLKTLNPEAKLPVSFVEKQELEEKIESETRRAKDAAEGVASEMKQLRAEMKAREERDREHRKLLSSGWDAEGIQAIEKLMLEKGIPEYDVAAAYYEKQLPKSDLGSPTGAAYDKGWNFAAPSSDSDDTTKLLFERDPSKRTRAHAMFTAKAIEAWKQETSGNRARG